MDTEISITKILLPVEFSDQCIEAARYAASLACRFHAELTVLHVFANPYVAWGDISAYSAGADYYARICEYSRSRLEAFLSDAPPGLRISRVLLEGDPARNIVEYAHAEKFDLIVMPTHGYGPFRRFLLGSVTAKVLHDSDCPLWTGPHLEQAPEWQGFSVRRVACALDLGPASCSVLRWAGALSRDFAADLLILHALPTATISIGGYTFDPEWRLHLVHEAREKIARLQSELGTRGDVFIEIGDVAAALTEAAREREADVLVIGRSCGTGVLGRLRADAYSILRAASCPVVSV